MAEDDRATKQDLDGATEALDRLATSAGGWHRIQLAVLGFIGFCGVLWDGSPAPAGLRWLAAGLVVLALALALFAIYLVGRVAYPLYGPAPAAGDARRPDEHARHLRTGIRVTYVAVALLATATLTGWWPAPDGNGAVGVVDVTGQAWCGELGEARAGEVRLATGEGPVTVPLDRVALLGPVQSC